MTRDEILARLRGGGVTLAFDTNALSGLRRLAALSEAVRRHSERNTSEGRAGIGMMVSTVAHAERLFDLKQDKRDRFDVGVILEGMRSLGISVAPFDARHALDTASRLGERYPSKDAWREAKRRRALHGLGLPAEQATPGNGKRCGMTADWHIGGHARAETAILVTDDTGPEFEGLSEQVKLDVLEAALQQLLGERS